MKRNRHQNPGVTLSYNYFHMAYYDSVFHPGKEVFCIDHCREGGIYCKR